MDADVIKKLVIKHTTVDPDSLSVAGSQKAADAIAAEVNAELKKLSDENLQLSNLLNGLADFIEEISVDFSNFIFKEDAHEEWRKWCAAYVNRPCQVREPRPAPRALDAAPIDAAQK